MTAAVVPRVAIDAFRRHYELLTEGATGTISAREIDPPSGVEHTESLADFRGAGEEALKRTVVLKLNGGLGTSMGMDRAKSLLPAMTPTTRPVLPARAFTITVVGTGLIVTPGRHRFTYPTMLTCRLT